MLSEIFQPFVKESPVSVMVGGLLTRVFCPDKLDGLFEANAQRQYTKELLFSTLFDLMSKVVCGIRPSVHAAYQATSEEIAVLGCFDAVAIDDLRPKSRQQRFKRTAEPVNDRGELCRTIAHQSRRDICFCSV